MKRQVLLATVVGVCAAGLSARAHHSYARFFDLCTLVTVEGTVEKIDWKEPHIWIDLKTDDGTAYRAEWTSPRGVARDGVTPEVLKPGDRLAITGSPPKDPDFGRAIGAKVVSALMQIRRPGDGWSWQRERGTLPLDCARP
jgi:hypothetical protein